jgi:transposase-like protein
LAAGLLVWIARRIPPSPSWPVTIAGWIFGESLHRGLRKIIKTRGAFPSDEAATKLLYLALRNLGVYWKPAVEWRAAYAQFAIFFSDRLPTTIR